MGFPLLCTVVRRRLVAAGVAARLAVCLVPIGKDQYRGRQCHVKGTNFTVLAGGSI